MLSISSGVPGESVFMGGYLFRGSVFILKRVLSTVCDSHAICWRHVPCKWIGHKEDICTIFARCEWTLGTALRFFILLFVISLMSLKSCQV